MGALAEGRHSVQLAQAERSLAEGRHSVQRAPQPSSVLLPLEEGIIRDGGGAIITRGRIGRQFLSRTSLLLEISGLPLLLFSPSLRYLEWAFWLNQRSEVNMVYKLPSTSSLFIIVAKGTAQFSNWVSDPSNPDSCSLWRPVSGHGTVSFQAVSDNDYYFGLGNLNEESVEIKFCMEIKSKTYETETANSWCPLDVKSCKILPSLRGSKVGLLTTPDKPQDGVDFWKVEVSYRTRWQTYLIFDGTLLFAVLFILYFICKPKGLSNLSPEETPLNSQQDAHTRSQEANIDSNSVQHFANEGEPRSWIDERTQFMETW
ncbi:E3 ubiquitin-protein ligase APD2 isoform X5 [Cryptomeria japonica]|uniref:E3 ubiquitin-protein ligase APD2 isoform X5 n=1 Tax=Cryptomeria japonica TaxID=3369 RepID=UPI0025AD9131|nr:E3 ubiquitin-protein ligase APD2 isoform X5 [Cryptomeria japonica]